MPILELDALQPTSKAVMVGKSELELYESPIDRAQAIFDAIANLEIEGLVEPFSNVLAELPEIDLSKSSGEELMKLIRAHAGPVIEAMRPILLKLGQALRTVVIAVLDTRSTRRALVTPPPGGRAPLELEAEGKDIETDSDGVYLGSRAVRVFLREQVTLKQAVHILLAAIEVNDVKGSLGNLFAGLMPTESAEEPAAPVPAKPKAKKRNKGPRRGRRT